MEISVETSDLIEIVHFGKTADLSTNCGFVKKYIFRYPGDFCKNHKFCKNWTSFKNCIFVENVHVGKSLHFRKKNVNCGINYKNMYRIIYSERN